MTGKFGASSRVYPWQGGEYRGEPWCWRAVFPPLVSYRGRASHMNMQVYFGVPVATVRAAYVKEAGAQDQSPTELERYKRDLQPSSTHRGKGANQFCAVTFRQRLDSAKGTDFILAIRNTNRWDTTGARQAYALAVQLERDTQHADLYAELRAQLEAVAEIEIGH